MSLLKHKLNYHHDSAILFEHIAQEPWAMFLDSGCAINQKTGKPGNEYGHYDIIVARPIATFVVNKTETKIVKNGFTSISKADPFDLLKAFLAAHPAKRTTLPFVGGALGYFSYDLGCQLASVTAAKTSEQAPDMMIGIYDWAIIVDHRLKETHLVSYGVDKNTRKKWANLCKLFEQKHASKLAHFLVASDIESNFTKATYQQAFNRIQAYIKEGDFYQVNLAQRFSVAVEGDAWIAYKKLREVSPAPFMAFMQLPLGQGQRFQVLSHSPERFVQVIGNHVETRPIKGTRPRSTDALQDAIYSKELLVSKKDRAENVMIVDLLRNDISKNCIIGSVAVKKLFCLQSFANVHHLVSIVKGHLKKTSTSLDLLKGCFPGGSITGAPKKRAMEVINQLEPSQRGIYCGAIGYIGFDAQLDTSIAIRTAIVRQGTLSFYAGGGIVAGSDCKKEYQETLDKAASMMAVLKHFMR